MAEREPPNFTSYSDRQVAADSMSMVRSIRDGSDIRDVASDMGKMLNVTVPAMAARAGVDLTAGEASTVADWEKQNGRPMNVHEARMSVRMGSREGRENFGVGHTTFAEKGGLISELVDRVERHEDATRPVDRQTDVVLLAGLPDGVMAAKALEHARDLRQTAGITERDGAVGDLLNRVVPVMAYKMGIPIDDHEHRVILEHGEKSRMRGDRPQQTIEDMSQTIMHAARDGRRMFPESAMFNAPEKGNIAAVMLDRMLRQENIHQSTRPDGSLEPYPGPDKSKREIVGVHGREAIGTHAVASHMLERTAAMGHHPMPYWSPGHLAPPRDAGRFVNLLSKESLLEISDKQVYAERISRLPDTELAAEMVEQAREMRERRPELAFAEHGYHRYMTWHGIPQMGTLFGQTMRPDEVETHPVKVEDDQQAFNVMSSATMHGTGEGQAYVLRGTSADHEPPSLSEKVMFNEPTHGNSMGMLLDRVAVALDVDRGEELDRMGRAIAEVGRHRGQGDHQYAWKPDVQADEEVSLRRAPAKEAERAAPEPERQAPAKGAMAAAFAAAGMGPGR